MRDDDDPEKWRYKEQTEVKHRLLEKYLGPWFRKISTQSREIHYIDGFAGRGEYEDGSLGSPIIAMETFDRKFQYEDAADKVDRVKVFAVEKNESNYRNLKEAIAEKENEVHPQITGEAIQGEFGSEAENYLDKYYGRAEPCFVFIDPFGFSGVPLEIVSQLMALRPTGIEVFITFMAGKMAQWYESESHQSAMDEIFGTGEWREHVDSDADKETVAEQLTVFYERQLRREVDAQFVWPFQMYEESKRQTAYYLIHATNHFDGFKLMKDNMFSIGADGDFVYLGPDHYKYEDEQMNLTGFADTASDEDEAKEHIKEIVLDRYAGERMRFGDIVRDLYVSTPYIEKQIRAACKDLAEEPDAEITNRPDREEGNPNYGLGLGDDIEFTGQTQTSLGQF